MMTRELMNTVASFAQILLQGFRITGGSNSKAPIDYEGMKMATQNSKIIYTLTD